jgi:hypothetical protein
MQTWQIVSITAAVVAAAAIIMWMLYLRNRSQHLRAHFGSEYDRIIAETGNRRRAELELEQREARVRKLEIHQLSLSDRDRFTEKWKLCQETFVNDPVMAVTEADRLVGEIMRARGYQVETTEDRIADISAAYPDHTTSYREALETVTRHRRGQATTEDLRKAFIHCRGLFNELLGSHEQEFRRAS